MYEGLHMSTLRLVNSWARIEAKFSVSNIRTTKLETEREGREWAYRR